MRSEDELLRSDRESRTSSSSNSSVITVLEFPRSVSSSPRLLPKNVDERLEKYDDDDDGAATSLLRSVSSSSLSSSGSESNVAVSTMTSSVVRRVPHVQISQEGGENEDFREDDGEGEDFDDEDIDDDEEFEDGDYLGVGTKKGGGAFSASSSLFGDEDNESNIMDDDDENYDSEDERQTEKLENYVLRHMEAPPPQPPPPPPSSSSGKRGDLERRDFGESNLDEKTIRNSLLEFVSRERCWSAAAAKRMTFTAARPSNALHYFIESFGEARTVSWSAEPFDGSQPIDGPANGDPPDPWTIPIHPPKLFAPYSCDVQVPHTASLRNCGECRGRGSAKCFKCKSKRNVKCNKCHGSGRTMKQGKRAKCSFCHGRGKKKCQTCGGDGKQKCKSCAGYCKLKYCIMLNVSFTVHKSDFVHDVSTLPSDVIKEETGEIVFEETRSGVDAIKGHPIPQVEIKSRELLEDHAELMGSERRLLQRHALTAIPVTEVHFRYKSQSGIFWIHGPHKSCFCPDYPEQNIWRGCLPF